jgi:esterase FrsA
MTVFYFAVGAQDNLTKDPFNQPVEMLKTRGISVITFSLPYHAPPFLPQNGIEEWIKAYKRGEDPLTPFFNDVAEKIQALGLDWSKTGVMGLSRGVFIGAHILKRIPQIPYFLGFAPMTSLNPYLNLDCCIEALSSRTIRFYIGNNDTRVGTDHCFSLIQSLVAKAKEQGKREIPIELIIGPSVGYKGHGTLPHIFADGVKWLGERFIE